VIKYLLQEIEKCSNPVFTQKGLHAISLKDFEYFLDKKIIAYSRPDETGMERIDYPRCQHGCALTIVQVDGGYEGVCLDHPEENPVPIKEEDLGRYVISIEALLNQIRIANKIEGKLHTIDGRYYYAGYKIYDTQRTGFIFVHNINKEPLASILGLKHLCREDNNLVILSPYSKIEDVTLRASLFSNRIIQAALADCLNTQTFEISVETAIIELLRKSEDLTISGNEKTNRTIVEIKLDFSDTKSKQLLKDLIACPSGVNHSINSHGENQPKAIKQMLKIKYPDIASDIHIEDGRIYLEKYTLKEKC
jgi:hypothetical protein